MAGAGKGDKWPETDYKRFWTNYTDISGMPSKLKPKKVKKLKNGRTRYTY